MIYVFLSRAVISSDSTVPLLLEVVDGYPGEKTLFVQMSRPTHAAMLSNVVLADAIDSMGRLVCLSSQNLKGLAFFWSRIRRWAFMFMALLRGILGRATFIHFGQLNEYPSRLLFMTNPRRTFYMQQSPVARTDLDDVIDRIRYPEFNPNRNFAAGALIAQLPTWDPLGFPELASVPRYVISPTGSRAFWYEYLRRVSPRYLSPLGITVDEDIAVFILGSMDPPNLTFYEDEYMQLFEHNLGVLADEVPDLPVVIKRHPKTTLHYIERINEVVARSRHKRAVVADIHPLLLAMRSRFFISNGTSTTYYNAKLLGVPIIEYVHYSPQVMEATGGKSMNPELTTYFIHYDEDELRQRIKEVMAAPPPERKAEYQENESYETVMRLIARRERLPD